MLNSYRYRKLIIFFHDVFASLIAWVAAYLFRFNFDIPNNHFLVMIELFWLILSIQITLLFIFSLYKDAWRFSSIPDLKKIFFFTFSTLIILSVLFYLLKSSFVVPRSVTILYPILLLSLMGGSRFFYRIFRELNIYTSYVSHGKPVVIYGSGQTALTLTKELSQSDSWRVVGLLSEDKSLFGREISGFKVLGNMSILTDNSNNVDFKTLILAAPELDHKDRRTIFSRCNDFDIEVLTIPTLNDLISGRIISQIRPIDVEDLLSREKVELDSSGLHKFINKNAVFISGAGGSIGSELCRQILKFKPKELICFDFSEYFMYKLEQELKLISQINITYIVGDVKDNKRLDKLFHHHQPRIVFHAAAYKHVPLMENNNVSEVITNNVVGTFELASACKRANVDKFVLISTDKAVNPTNIMGSSKRLAEMVCQGLQEKNGTRFIVVRFGNVLGSSGSVIPKFRKQISEGGPVTVTHPDITRYFMSIPEASQLVMQASLMGKGGEIFVLDMGDPVRIKELAKDMIRLSGYSEDEIQIEFTGLRPGEKLFEELFGHDENSLPTPHKKLYIASARSVDKRWVIDLLEWVNDLLNKDEKIIKEELKNWVVEYYSQENKP